MSELTAKVKELFQNGKVDVMIGYAEGPAKSVRPHFAVSPGDADNFIFDERCKNNLAGYVRKAELKKLGRIGFVANLPSIKTIMQLASENQIIDGQVIALAINKEGKVAVLDNFADMQNFIASATPGAPPPIMQKVEELKAKTREERWDYWTKELSNCIKCYACRSACPLCYCEQCAVENNNPQWIPIAPHWQGNIEWHILRAMHLAGRCIGCGECSRACPADIPVGMFNMVLNGFIVENFGQQAGLKPDAQYALSVYKVEDKENFIR
jgi:ferredoxin